MSTTELTYLNDVGDEVLCKISELDQIKSENRRTPDTAVSFFLSEFAHKIERRRAFFLDCKGLSYYFLESKFSIRMLHSFEEKPGPHYMAVRATCTMKKTSQFDCITIVCKNNHFVLCWIQDLFSPMETNLIIIDSLQRGDCADNAEIALCCQHIFTLWHAYYHANINPNDIDQYRSIENCLNRDHWTFYSQRFKMKVSYGVVPIQAGSYDCGVACILYAMRILNPQECNWELEERRKVRNSPECLYFTKLSIFNVRQNLFLTVRNKLQSLNACQLKMREDDESDLVSIDSDDDSDDIEDNEKNDEGDEKNADKGDDDEDVDEDDGDGDNADKQTEEQSDNYW